MEPIMKPAGEAGGEAAPSVLYTLDLKFGTPKHDEIKKKITARVQLADSRQNARRKIWKDAEERVLAYLPETEADARRRVARENLGHPKYTTIQIPYTYALTMTMHTYLTNVFFARTPIHQYTGRHGESEQQIQAIEALIDYQVTVGGAIAPYYVWLYDALKYGVGIVGSYWCQKITRWSELVPDPASGKQVLVTHELPGYKGNEVYNVSPFDFLPDPRVSVGKYQTGEFCAIRKYIPWSEILLRRRLGYYVNVDEAGKRNRDYQSQIKEGSSQLERPFQNEFLDDGTENPPPAVVTAYEVYVRLVPSQWGLGNGDFPELWVFTITSDYSVILGAQPLGSIADRFPFDVLEPEVEAYGTWNRGVPEIMAGIQQTMDWLVNTHFFNVRAALNNQFLVDPTKVVLQDLKRGEPGLVLRMRPEAYGSDLRTFFHQLDVRDVTQQHMVDMNSMFGIGERMMGVNDQMFGVLQGGGRKTATEVRTSTGFGVNRQKTIAEYMSAAGFSSHSRLLLTNSQQFYDAETKLRIVGDLAMEAGQQFVMVTPDMIVGHYDFVPVDGTLPIDRQAQVQLWTNIFGQLRQMPDIAIRYDLGRIFAWVGQLAGIKNMNKFRIQVVSDGQLADQAQRGNVIPLPNQQPAAPKALAPTPTSVAPGL